MSFIMATGTNTASNTYQTPITTTTTTIMGTIFKVRQQQQIQQQPQQQQQQQQTQTQQKRVKVQQHRQLLLVCLAILIGVSVIVPHGSNAMPLTGGDAHSVEFKRYCSNTLSDAIRLICGGRYYSLGRKFPESVGHGPVRSLQSLATSDDDDDSYYRPLTSGPIHECCRRPCGYSQLKLYCAVED